jgi:hypothetical protein
LVTVPGCTRVKDDKVLELTPGLEKTLEIPACKKYDVTFSTTDNVPVEVYILSKADGDDAKTSQGPVAKEKKLFSKDNATSEKFEFAANGRATVLVFESKKKTTVTVKIVGE